MGRLRLILVAFRFHMDFLTARPPHDDETAVDLSRQMEVRRPAPAWALSIVTHVAIGVILGLTLQTAPRGAAIEPERSAGIVLVQKNRGHREYFQDPGDSNIEVPSTTADAAPSTPTEALPSASQPPSEVAGVLPRGDESLADGSDLAHALPAADGMTAGVTRAKDFGGGVQTSVFGAQGVGTKFVYVFDRSSSMEGFEGRPMAAAKHELIASLGDLGDVHQFQIVFYNDRLSVCNARPGLAPRLLYGNERDRTVAIDFVRGMSGSGGTRHFPALMLALSMNPDVIFFLTDAGEPSLSTDELAQIARANRRYGVTINSIEFGVGRYSGDLNFLVKLAKQNNGYHTYVDVTKLPPRY